MRVARGKRGAGGASRRLRIVVCATVGDDNRATAAAAHEPALFTSAQAVRADLMMPRRRGPGSLYVNRGPGTR